MLALPATSLKEQKPVLLPIGSDLLRDAMRPRGKTVTSLAAELGISCKHLSNVLNGRTPLFEPLLGRLAKVTGADPVLLRATVRVRRTRRPASYGAMKGTIRVLCDPIEDMEHWEMLED